MWLELNSAKPIQTKPNRMKTWMDIINVRSVHFFRALPSPYPYLSLARIISMNEKCSSFRILTACLPALQFCYSIMPCLPFRVLVRLDVWLLFQWYARVFHLLLALFCRIDPLSLQQLSHISSVLPFTHLNFVHIYIHGMEHIFVHLWFYECINFSGELF